MSDYTLLGQRFWDSAEGGFLEWKTQAILEEQFRDAGFEVEPFGDIPGLRARWAGDSGAGGAAGSPRPGAGSTGLRAAGRIALISDMDALPLGEGRYRHMCGHYQQLTALVSTAKELARRAPELLDEVDFIACPAEEYVELDRRRKLRETSGTITYLSGKQELLHRGVLDGYAAIIATHSARLPQRKMVSSVRKMNGFNELKLTFRGVSAHAGAAPEKGRNAQNAAALFLQAAAFLRERFVEEEHIRIHPVLRLPPDQPVSFVPEIAVVESYVRGATPEAVERTAGELIDAAEGCAKAIGVTVEIDLQPGYKPLATNELLHELVGTTAADLGVDFEDEEFGAASTDVGDISQQIPAVIVGLPGTNGHFHRPDFRTVDESLAFDFPPEFLVPYLRNVLDQRGELKE